MSLRLVAPDAAPSPTPLEFCVNCGRIVVQEKGTGRWTHWGDAVRHCWDAAVAAVATPGGLSPVRRLPVGN